MTLSPDERITRARVLYERAVFGGDDGALATAGRDLDAVEADLALARGRVAHARFLANRHEDPHELELFERAAKLYRSLGDLRGEAESLFWVGTFHQVVRNDHATALPALERSYELATDVGDRSTMSYALRHLAFVAQASGDTVTARERLEESTRLRREIGFLPGVAANLLGLAYVADEEGRRDDARALIEDAADAVKSSGAWAISRHVEEARTRFGAPER